MKNINGRKNTHNNDVNNKSDFKLLNNILNYSIDIESNNSFYSPFYIYV